MSDSQTDLSQDRLSGLHQSSSQVMITCKHVYKDFRQSVRTVAYMIRSRISSFLKTEHKYIDKRLTINK